MDRDWVRFFSDDERTEYALSQKLERDRSALSALALQAYAGEHFDFAIRRYDPLTRLAVMVLLLAEKWEAYKAKGISDAVIRDTFQDVSLRARLYAQTAGQAGLSEADVIWFRHIVNVSIFKIGALQYQPFAMIYLDEEGIGEAYMDFLPEWKAKVPAGSPVVNCHIQHGADLRPDVIGASFQNAELFFAEVFPETPYRAFLCYSWLLYPPMLAHLGEASNIRHFAGRFSIIGSCSDASQAEENLFRPGAAQQTSPETSLQRAYLEHPEHFGMGCGVWLLS